ncbi:MAG: rhodanese-like domain-containing protein [bacterium]|jgi:rhodanese-related sulfurtransferase|nr:rhodanese-like domain-containing protein [bacterium]
MPIQQMVSTAAKEAMDATKNAIYLDVRTEGEFAQGHPAGAINIPVAHPGPAGMTPNPDFIKVAEAVLKDKNQPIFCGCQMGGRSQMAATVLEQSGYKNLTNVQGGFGGKVEGGAVVVPGWRDSGLPVESRVDEKNSYAGLKAQAAL